MYLQNFTLDEFRHMCILSGCDYLPSVPGIGLTTAHKLMKKYARNVNNVSRNRDHNTVHSFLLLYHIHASENVRKVEETMQSAVLYICYISPVNCIKFPIV